jgi:N-acetyl sugar amidotransferase
MNVLYLANPQDNHDLKWISYFIENNDVRGFLMPRKSHQAHLKMEIRRGRLDMVDSIPDFSIVRFHQTVISAFRIKKFIKRNNIHAIHILFAEPNALWCLFRDFFKIPIIVTCRGTDVLKTIPRVFETRNLINFFVAPAYKMAFTKADYVTGTSHQQLRSVYNFSGKEAATSIVRTGVDIPRILNDTSKFFPLNDSVKYILFPRYIKPLYNHEFCLEAVNLLGPEVKANYKMVFIGKNVQPHQAEYQNLLEGKMKLMDVSFIFLPDMEQEAMFELYKRSSLVVMTPHSDGSPVSAMEAIVCGAQVILGPLQYDEEIFKAWTFQLKSWDSTELAQLITDCLSSKKTIDVNNYVHLVDRDREMKKVLEIYKTVLGPSAKQVLKMDKVDASPYVQCSRCILDTNDDADITFDINGVCNHCVSYLIQEAKLVKVGIEGETELQRLVDQIKKSGIGKPYDSIIGLSGGVDSTYLAYQAKKLGLRPLAVHFDNGWNSELAVSNIENIITKLGFDLHTFVIDWKEFKDLQLSFLKASVVDIEMLSDHAIVTKLYQLALKNKIKYILSGTNVVTEAVLPPSWIHDKRDHIHIRAIQEQFGSIPIKTYPLFTSPLKWKVIWNGIKSLSLLDLMPYNKKEVKKLISKELGWRDYGGKHYESVFTRFYQGYILPNKFKIDKRKAHLSNLICSGQITREEAVEEMKQPIYNEAVRNADYEFVIKKFGLTSAEFEAIMNAPVRLHNEFPVEKSIYDRFPLLKLVRPVWLSIKNIRRLS